MKSLVRYIFPAAAVFALAAGAAQADTSSAVRHLVYTFDVTLSTTSTVHDSGIGGGPASGSADYRAGTSDKGQVTVDVVAVQPDTGLVVNVAEHARGTRSNEPTMCVVYGNGSVICDQTKGGPSEEEMSLLRTLGRNFINPSVIDNKHHWQNAQSNGVASETDDYTINKTDGDVLGISFQRVLKVGGSSPYSATTDGNLTYNQKMSVPETLVEDTITRKNTGMGNYDTVDQKISFNLATDSMAQAAH